MKDVRTACCCVEQNAEIVIPIPDAVIRNSKNAPKKNESDPLNGMSYKSKASGVMVKSVTISIVKQGIVLPSISSNREIGATISCSIVPISLSRTMTADVRIIARVKSRRTTTPGHEKVLGI